MATTTTTTTSKSNTSPVTKTRVTTKRTETRKDSSDYARHIGGAIGHGAMSILTGGLSVLFGFFLIAFIFRAANGLPFVGVSDFIKSLSTNSVDDTVTSWMDDVTQWVQTNENIGKDILGWIANCFLFWMRFFGSFFVTAFSLVRAIFFKGGANGFNESRKMLWDQWVSSLVMGVALR